MSIMIDYFRMPEILTLFKLKTMLGIVFRNIFGQVSQSGLWSLPTTSASRKSRNKT